MTEKQGAYDTKGPHLSISTNELIHPWAQQAQTPRTDLLTRISSLHERVVEWKTEIKTLKAANDRLNEQLRKLSYDLAQCRENGDRHKLQRNEARQWARDLLARAENLDWVVERVGASWREDVEELEKAQERIAELEQPEPDADEVLFGATKRLHAAKHSVATLREG